MEKSYIIFLLVILPVALQAIYISSMDESLVKTVRGNVYYFHSYSIVKDSKYSESFVVKLSNTWAGGMLKLVQYFDAAPNTSLMLSTLTQDYKAIFFQEFSEFYDVGLCDEIRRSVRLSVALLTDTPKLSIVLYGCDLFTLSHAEVFFVESNRSTLPNDPYTSAELAPPKQFSFRDENYGFCTCQKLPLIKATEAPLINFDKTQKVLLIMAILSILFAFYARFYDRFMALSES